MKIQLKPETIICQLAQIQLFRWAIMELLTHNLHEVISMIIKLIDYSLYNDRMTRIKIGTRNERI